MHSLSIEGLLQILPLLNLEIASQTPFRHTAISAGGHRSQLGDLLIKQPTLEPLGRLSVSRIRFGSAIHFHGRLPQSELHENDTETIDVMLRLKPRAP